VDSQACTLSECFELVDILFSSVFTTDMVTCMQKLITNHLTMFCEMCESPN